MVHASFEPYIAKQFNRSRPDFLAGKLALKLHGQLYILKSGKTANQIESLKYKTQLV